MVEYCKSSVSVNKHTVEYNTLSLTKILLWVQNLEVNKVYASENNIKIYVGRSY